MRKHIQNKGRALLICLSCLCISGCNSIYVDNLLQSYNSVSMPNVSASDSSSVVEQENIVIESNVVVSDDTSMDNAVKSSLVSESMCLQNLQTESVNNEEEASNVEGLLESSEVYMSQVILSVSSLDNLYELDISEKVSYFYTEIPVKILDSTGNPIANVGITELLAETSSKYGTASFRDDDYQRYITNQNGEVTISYSSHFPEAMLVLVAPQENAIAKTYVDYQRKREFFRFSIDPEKSVQDQVVLQMNNRYSWPENVPTLEITLLDQQGKPCANYWCGIYKKNPEVVTQAQSVSSPVRGDGYTDKDGKITCYGIESGNWVLLTESEEVWTSEDNYHFQEIPFILEKVDDNRNIAMTLLLGS